MGNMTGGERIKMEGPVRISVIHFIIIICFVKSWKENKNYEMVLRKASVLNENQYILKHWTEFVLLVTAGVRARLSSHNVPESGTDREIYRSIFMFRVHYPLSCLRLDA